MPYLMGCSVVASLQNFHSIPFYRLFFSRSSEAPPTESTRPFNLYSDIVNIAIKITLNHIVGIHGKFTIWVGDANTQNPVLDPSCTRSSKQLHAVYSWLLLRNIRYIPCMFRRLVDIGCSMPQKGCFPQVLVAYCYLSGTGGKIPSTPLLLY